MHIAESDQPFVEALAREAGALLMRYQREGFEVAHKGAIDLVTTADRASDQLISRALAARYPSHLVISEEDAAKPQAVDGAPVWYVDPLDGTTGFAHGYPAFAVSIGLYERGEARLGVVYDPTRDELFSARLGHGARLNGQPIHVSRTNRLIESLLTSGFPYDIGESGSNLAEYQRLTLLSRGVRISGAAALDLAWVACGRVDGYWEPEIAPWDGAAGALIVREAGGQATHYDNRDWKPSRSPVVASNGQLHRLLLDQINP
ncbi:MAG: inositol monophosphatase [Chloroflexi bacterium]|nr:inositol monophosphatase [Chloroflexota bacterium]